MVKAITLVHGVVHAIKLLIAAPADAHPLSFTRQAIR